MAQALGAQPLFAAPPQFDSNAETWTNYSERLESYFDANEITDDARKRAILITCLNPEVYGRLRSLLAPKKPRDEPYEAIIALLKQHLNPAPSEIYKTYRFQTRVQKTGEKVGEYLAELRKIADNCGFGSALERNLRDRFVIGLREKMVQRVLLAKPKSLTLQEAVDIATSTELAIQNVERLPHASTAESANEVNATAFKKKTNPQYRHTKAKTPRPCNRCGDCSHDAPNSPHKTSTCYKCHKQGHLATRCFGGVKAKRPTKFQANAVSGEAGDSSCTPVLDIYTVTSEGTAVEPVYKTVKWGPVNLDMQVDTGSPVCIIPEEIYYFHAKQWPALKPTNKELHCYLGKLPISGCFI
ncbi:uncharacterized protein LOC144116162 [Amblyomma americanum]